MTHSMLDDVDALGPWTAHIQTMDQMLAKDDPEAAVRAWRQAYSAALSNPGWRGLLTVATAALRLRALSGVTREAMARARETYWIAFFRARQQSCLDGVLSAAAAFESLGDSAAFERSIRAAEVLVTRTSEAAKIERLRQFIEAVTARPETV
jgi:hypothetical protein